MDAQAIGVDKAFKFRGQEELETRYSLGLENEASFCIQKIFEQICNRRKKSLWNRRKKKERGSRWVKKCRRSKDVQSMQKHAGLTWRIDSASPGRGEQKGRRCDVRSKGHLVLIVLTFSTSQSRTCAKSKVSGWVGGGVRSLKGAGKCPVPEGRAIDPTMRRTISCRYKEAH